MYCFLSHIESSMLNTHHVYCFCLFWGVKGLMFTTDGRPVGEKVPGGTATVYSMPYWSTVRPVMAPASLPQADSGSCLLCLATTTSRDHSEASLEGVWLVEQLVVLPISLLVTGRSLFFWWKACLTPLMNRFHIALWCSWILERVGLLLGVSEGLLCDWPTPLCAVGWSAHI